MFETKRSLVSASIALVTVCLTTTLPVDARTRNWFMTGRSLGGSNLEEGWHLSEMTDSVGGVYSGNVCGIHKEFPSGTTVGFFDSVQARSAFVSVSNKDWQSLKGRHGQTTPLVLHIKSSGRRINLTADIIGDTNTPELSADVPYGERDALYVELERATELEIVAGDRPVFTQEIQAANAIQALKNCVTEINAAVAKQRSNDPFN